MASTSTICIGGLCINSTLYDFIEKEVLTPPKGVEDLRIDSKRFWHGLENTVRKLAPQCEALLQKRESFQRQINQWHRTTGSHSWDAVKYKKFLYSIGYLVDQGDDFEVMVENVDSEISKIAGPQLVVPLTNARFALNAANSRWGSLFDSLYSSDVISEAAGLQQTLSGATSYNPKRGAAVISRSCHFLDSFCSLSSGSYGDILSVELKQTVDSTYVEFELPPHYRTTITTLKDPALFVGYSGDVRPNGGMPKGCFSILLRHNNLHIELVFDRSDSQANFQHPAALKDIVLESAISTIQDCEDSVTVVDVDDKVILYRNWLGLTLGTLSFKLPNGKVRSLLPDRQYKTPYGETFTLPGRSLMLIRHVGHHMWTDIVTISQTGQPIPEGFLDAFVTSLIALYDLRHCGKYKNSRSGSVYIVKPKQHGPEEVRLTDELFSMVEQTLGLPRYTLKLGLMDEERRTSLNLKACIREAQRRTIFINTGFLDRTGDEIHTSFELGPFDLKEKLKKGRWIDAYERQNVIVGLQCGIYGRGQIGKGMWPEPDSMKAMLESKIQHPKAGATTSWVPSPKAATLHALHYHEVSVRDKQKEIIEGLQSKQVSQKIPDIEIPHENQFIDALLDIQIIHDRSRLSDREIQKELDNNLQGLLGYVVRWADQGIGCSKIPNIDGIGLMEDRATLRISSQHVANWLRHGIVTEGQVFDTLRHMAAVVDQQNSSDPKYQHMESRPFSSLAYQAATELVFRGSRQPNGYTEFILHKYRREFKKRARGKEDNDESTQSYGSRWCKM